ncbi:hypothetical protein RCL1_002469 [Eukaryota sp. TZLM3-RCL]
MVLLTSSQEVNPRLVEAQYAVRGAIVIRAGDIDAEMKKGQTSYPFDNIVYLNIGNPMQLMQKPLTFPRQVLSLFANPQLMDDHPEIYPIDVVKRARKITSSIPGYNGAYSHSQGHAAIRTSVQNFIKKRDDVEIPLEDVYLTDGASQGVSNILRLLIRDENDGILIPIPQYPLYSATITLCGGQIVPYYLEESLVWGLNIESLQRSFDEATAKGIKIRAIAVINPGNPTGSILTREQVSGLLKFAEQHNIVVMADEVYQENVYTDVPFVSFLRVAHEENINVELASFHSCSKGFLGECGLRGGFFVLKNWTDVAKGLLYKLASIGLCPNVMGQVMVETMVNPPQEGDASYETYNKEKTDSLESLKRRAYKTSQMMNQLPNVSCQPVQGALYAFPCIQLPPKAVEAARAVGKAPDVFYCMQMLEEAGLCVVPGTGFGMPDNNSYFFRTSILPREEVFDDVMNRFAAFHQSFIARYQ